MIPIYSYIVNTIKAGWLWHTWESTERSLLTRLDIQRAREQIKKGLNKNSCLVQSLWPLRGESRGVFVHGAAARKHYSQPRPHPFICAYRITLRRMCVCARSGNCARFLAPLRSPTSYSALESRLLFTQPCRSEHRRRARRKGNNSSILIWTTGGRSERRMEWKYNGNAVHDPTVAPFNFGFYSVRIWGKRGFFLRGTVWVWAWIIWKELRFVNGLLTFVGCECRMPTTNQQKCMWRSGKSDEMKKQNVLCVCTKENVAVGTICLSVCRVHSPCVCTHRYIYSVLYGVVCMQRRACDQTSWKILDFGWI